MPNIGWINGQFKPLEEVLELLAGSISFRKARLKITSEFPVIKGDRHRIREVWQNLLENAMKYARTDGEKPTIELTIEDNGNEIMISVVDNGIGMSEEAQSKIFKMFYRANRTIEGTGLGLHIVNRAIEKLNGRVELTSKLNVGSSFHVFLPKK